MSDKTNEMAADAATELKHVPPANLPEELLPVYDWYMGKGKDQLLTAAIALVAVIAVMAVVKFRDNQNAEASFALTGAEGIESLEGLNAKYGRTAVAPVISLRLAKAYYDAGNFAEAANTYQAFSKKNRKHILAPQAKLGYAASLEAEQKFDDAKAAYADLAKDTSSVVYPEAIMGQARCLAAQGEKSAATDLLDRLMIDKKDTRWEGMAENLRDIIDRFEGFKNVSIFDKLSVADGSSAAEEKAAAEEVVKSEEKAAPAEAPAAAAEAK